MTIDKIKECYDIKTNKLAEIVVNEFSKKNNRMDGIIEQEKPYFEDVKTANRGYRQDG